MKSYFMLNTKPRTAAKNEFEKNVSKLGVLEGPWEILETTKT